MNFEIIRSPIPTTTSAASQEILPWPVGFEPPTDLLDGVLCSLQLAHVHASWVCIRSLNTGRRQQQQQLSGSHCYFGSASRHGESSSGGVPRRNRYGLGLF